MIQRICTAFGTSAIDIARGHPLQPVQELDEAKNLLELLAILLEIFEVRNDPVLDGLRKLTVGSSSTTMLDPTNDWTVSAR